MKPERVLALGADQIARVADYAARFRAAGHPLDPTATTDQLRAAFCGPLGEAPMDGAAVIDDLIAAAEPGLVGNTDPNFYAWVMGGSDMVGVSADMLTSVWGQNAAIFQTSPAAAIAEEAVAAWLLDLLDLPRDSSVGLVTGATMATFVALAAARSEVLRRHGHDVERDGLQGAPFVRIYMSDDAHVANRSALRYLGFGEANLVRVASDARGLMHVDALAGALQENPGPRIIVGQAGHINSGGFEDFTALSQLARRHDAWLHVDGAFGLWARVLPEKAALTAGLERADSWSVDGHKWLQIPYDSGFAIVRHAAAHRRAMDMSAGYLNQEPGEGRNPTEYNPELSRRARGFAAWAVLRSLGKSGVRRLVAGHCAVARRFAGRIGAIDGLTTSGLPDLNQVIVEAEGDGAAPRLAARINASGAAFVKTALWKDRTVLRFSFIANGTSEAHGDALADLVAEAWEAVR